MYTAFGNNRLIENMVDTAVSQTTSFQTTVPQTTASPLLPTDYFNLAGNLNLAGSIRATNYYKYDGTTLPSVTQLALPSSVYYVNKKLGINQPAPNADFDINGSLNASTINSETAVFNNLNAGMVFANNVTSVNNDLVLKASGSKGLTVQKNTGNVTLDGSISGVNSSWSGNLTNTGTLTTGGLLTANNGAIIDNIKFSKLWSSYPDNKTDGSEISNDTGSFKQLMIVGNKSAGGRRQVGIWDDLTVNGNLKNTGKMIVGNSVNGVSSTICDSCYLPKSLNIVGQDTAGSGSPRQINMWDNVVIQNSNTINGNLILSNNSLMCIGNSCVPISNLINSQVIRIDYDGITRQVVTLSQYRDWVSSGAVDIIAKAGPLSESKTIQIYFNIQLKSNTYGTTVDSQTVKIIGGQNNTNQTGVGVFNVDADDGVMFEVMYDLTDPGLLTAPTYLRGIADTKSPNHNRAWGFNISPGIHYSSNTSGWKDQASTKYNYTIPSVSKNGIIKCKLSYYNNGGEAEFKIYNLALAIQQIGTLCY